MVARRAGEDGLAADADELGERTFELSQFLTDVLGVTDAVQLGSYFPHSVTYHPSCHGMRLLRLGDRQKDLLRTVGGIDVHELPDAEECCGFGGTFSFKNPDVSGAMAEAKLRSIERTDTELCAGGDASCLLHLSGAAHRRRTPVRTVHLAEILASTRQNPLELDDIAELSIPQGTASIGPRAEAPAVETAEGAAR